jgi:hypothetical protein
VEGAFPGAGAVFPPSRTYGDAGGMICPRIACGLCMAPAWRDGEVWESEPYRRKRAGNNEVLVTVPPAESCCSHVWSPVRRMACGMGLVGNRVVRLILA